MHANQSINKLLHLLHPYKLIHLSYRQQSWSMPVHDHSFYQCIFIVDGILQLSVKGVNYSIGRGQACFIPPGVPHSLRTETGYQQVGIDFEETDPRGLVELLLSHIPDFIILDQTAFLSAIPGLKKEADILTRLSKQKIVHALDSFLLSCIEINTDAEQLEFKNRLISYLQQSLPRKVTIHDVCNHLNTSSSQLQRFTYKEFGCGVIEFYNQLRINKACTLLTNTQLTIAEISGSLGFYDQAYFSRYFKKKMKLSPSEYRNDGRV